MTLSSSLSAHRTAPSVTISYKCLNCYANTNRVASLYLPQRTIELYVLIFIINIGVHTLAHGHMAMAHHNHNDDDRDRRLTKVPVHICTIVRHRFFSSSLNRFDMSSYSNNLLFQLYFAKIALCVRDACVHFRA